jgi:hypothetical protein
LDLQVCYQNVPATALRSPDVTGKEKTVTTPDPMSQAARHLHSNDILRELQPMLGENGQSEAIALEYLFDLDRSRARRAGAGQ